MGLFDWIPTVTEVVEAVACTLTDHDWRTYVAIDGHVYKECKSCGKSVKVT
jgi:hypothetical protein